MEKLFQNLTKKSARQELGRLISSAETERVLSEIGPHKCQRTAVSRHILVMYGMERPRRYSVFHLDYPAYFDAEGTLQRLEEVPA